MSKIFLDTNILIYTLDQKCLEKRQQARGVFKSAVELHRAVISTQVINEFFVVATTKLKADPLTIKAIIHNFSNLEIVHTDLALIEQAIDISIICKLSFWDSLIIAAAEKAHCEFVLSEDMNDGQVYRGITLVNPFNTASLDAHSLQFSL